MNCALTHYALWVVLTDVAPSDRSRLPLLYEHGSRTRRSSRLQPAGHPCPLCGLCGLCGRQWDGFALWPSFLGPEYILKIFSLSSVLEFSYFTRESSYCEAIFPLLLARIFPSATPWVPEQFFALWSRYLVGIHDFASVSGFSCLCERWLFPLTEFGIHFLSWFCFHVVAGFPAPSPWGVPMLRIHSWASCISFRIFRTFSQLRFHFDSQSYSSNTLLRHPTRRSVGYARSCLITMWIFQRGSGLGIRSLSLITVCFVLPSHVAHRSTRTPTPSLISSATTKSTSFLARIYQPTSSEIEIPTLGNQVLRTEVSDREVNFHQNTWNSGMKLTWVRETHDVWRSARRIKAVSLILENFRAQSQLSCQPPGYF